MSLQPKRQNLRALALVAMVAAITALTSLTGCQKDEQRFSFADGQIVPDAPSVEGHDHEHADDDAGFSELIVPFACTKATAAQIAVINRGNKKYDKFMKGCWGATNNSSWCEQLTRPNPSSRSIFVCTYGADQPHRLIHPDESTWKNAFGAVKLVEELEAKGMSVQQIYNWWRPAPYNGNVGGASGRHPYGTSVDVRFTNLGAMERAHKQLCTWRAQGRLKALGYYGSTGLHFGIGDQTPNTWGKSCP